MQVFTTRLCAMNIKMSQYVRSYITTTEYTIHVPEYINKKHNHIIVNNGNVILSAIIARSSALSTMFAGKF